MRMTRAEFLKLAGLAATQFHSALGWSKLAHAGEQKRGLIPVLYGSPRPESDLEAWFASLKSWGVRRWMAVLNDYRNSAAAGIDNRGPVVPFLVDALPEFRDFVDRAEEERKAHHILRQAELSERNGIEFWIAMPAPIFPSVDQKTIRRALPSLYRDNHFDMRSPRIAQIVLDEIRVLKKRIPNLRGVDFTLAEGSGVVELSHDDVAHAAEWEAGILRALDSARRECGIDIDFCSHHFGLTVGGKRAVFERAAQFPALTVREDITWPEEDMLHPFLGYLPDRDRDLLFRSNPVALKFLMDTEYIGQGVLPSVYPRWWKYNMRASAEAGVKVAMGRTFFWDGGLTDKNFNRLNCFIFSALCHNPDADEKELLRRAVQESFGKGTSQELVELLWDTEPIIKDVIGINSVDPLNHSRFPRGDSFDQRKDGMKAVSDLFQIPGTALYPPLTDDLNNLRQWRWQNKTVSEPASKYLSVKQAAAKWAGQAVVRAKQVSAPLSEEKRKLVVDGYDALNCLAQAMYVYVQAADLYYRWGYEKIVDDSAARAQFEDMASQLDKFAELPGASQLAYRSDLKAFAVFLRTKLPHSDTKELGRT